MLFELISTFKDEILKVSRSHLDEIRQSIDDGLQAYTENWYNKINNVKTFVFSENAVSFEDIYVPLSLRFEKKKISLPPKVESLFKTNNCITILGHAGSGKTMLMKHSFLNILTEGAMIPVIIELRRIDNTEMSLAEYVSSLVFKLNLARNESIFTRMMGKGRFVFFFDGFDEIAITNKERRSAEIEEFVDRYNKNCFMLTSRPGANAETLGRFMTYHVCDMDDNQVRTFVNKQARKMGEDGDVIADKILSTIFEGKNSTIKDYLCNPLLLSMFIVTFRYTPELPSKKSDFYFNVFDTLYCKHDTTSKTGGYLHERKCKMEKDQYFRILQNFSYESYFSSKYEFDNAYINSVFEKVKKNLSLKFCADDMIYDLSVSIGIWILDGLTYNFPHRSMQEYFAASLISRSEEEIRKLVYTQILTKKYGYDGFNFWSLCQELDEYCFLKYFVLHNLKALEKQLLTAREDVSDESFRLVLNYIDMYEFHVAFDDDGHVEYMRSRSNFYMSLLRFLRNGPDFSNIMFDWMTTSQTKLSTLFDSREVGRKHLFKLDYHNDRLKDFIINSNLPANLYNHFMILKEYIQSLEKELKEKKEKEIAILGL